METSENCDSDYDVIYVNSPVYESMVEAGLSIMGEDDVQTRLLSENSNSKAEAKLPFLNIEPLQAVSVRLCHALKNIVSSINPSIHGTWAIAAHRKLFNKLSASPLLSEEDGFFLHSFQDEELDEVKNQPKSSLRIVVSFFLAMVLVLNTTRFCDALGFWFLQALNTTAALTCAVFMPYFLKMAFMMHTKSQTEKFLQTIQKFLDIASSSLDTVSKSIRFIQEAELVARGFTFVGNVDIPRVLSEYQKSSFIRQCPDLRQRVFLTEKAQLVLFRQSFRQLVESCPVKVEVAGVTHYCSEIPLTQYPEIIQINAENSDILARLHEVTDGFSIDILKSMLELNRIHASEFIRRLAVCFLPRSIGARGKKDLFLIWNSMLQAMISDLEAGQTELKSLLDAHRRGPLSSALHHPKLVTQQPSKLFSQSKDTYLAVHSLELHLLAALKRVQNVGQAMEAWLEKINSKNQKKEVDAEDKKQEESNRREWSSMLCLVKSELNACVGCWEEAARRLETKSSIGSEVLPAPAQTPQTLAEGTNVYKVIKVSADDTPIILDEVFEGFSEEQEDGLKRNGLDWMQTEEEAGLKQQQKNLKLCLLELDSIIAMRAAQRMEREQAALARMSEAPPDNVFQLQQTDAAPGSNVTSWPRVRCSESLDPGEGGRGTDVDNSAVALTLTSELNGHLGQVTEATCDVSTASLALESCSFSGRVPESLSPGTTCNLVPRSALLSSSGEEDSTESGAGPEVSLATGTVKAGTDHDEFPDPHRPDDQVVGDLPIGGNGAERRGGKAAVGCGSQLDSMAEYLSLPGAPSPFASGVAALVASRARTLRRTVETFGDASSSDETSEKDSDYNDEDEQRL